TGSNCISTSLDDPTNQLQSSTANSDYSLPINTTLHESLSWLDPNYSFQFGTLQPFDNNLISEPFSTPSENLDWFPYSGIANTFDD
ncbi:29898_t:CDS:1, partial [Racocetra persica]